MNCKCNPSKPLSALGEAHGICRGALQALKEVAGLDLGVLLRGLAHPRRRQLAAGRVHALASALICGAQRMKKIS